MFMVVIYEKFSKHGSVNRAEREGHGVFYSCFLKFFCNEAACTYYSGYYCSKDRNYSPGSCIFSATNFFPCIL